ncbi:MAG TPA: chemotaxis protein CheW, partial [Thermoanaerobaculia bacterium]|nr:chemotaxis protein CheW [Thermoanaerobaculia bacterium]
MVDLAKIRKKARKKAEPPPAPIQPVPAAEPPPSPQSKLERFLVQAGTRRFEPHLPETKTEEEVELLTFLLGRERYAVDIAPIAQIIASRAPTRVPNAGEGIIGILSLRGSIVTLI